MTPRTRRVSLVAGLGAALAASAALATTAVAAPTATPSTAGPSSGAVPAVKVGPPHVAAGTLPDVSAKARRSTSISTAAKVLFSCQKPSGTIRCYGPQQMWKAYGTDRLIGSGYTGKGRTIVIVDAYQSPTVQADLDLFDEAWGLPDTTLKVVAPDGRTAWDPTDDNQVSWAQEISLDVQWAHAIAPRAKIVLALAKSSNDSDLQRTLKYVVDHRLGDVLSQSFGEAEACYGVNADGSHQPGTTLAAAHRIYASAAAKGMTVFASSGDFGSAEPTCDGSGAMLAASTPATDPLVTGVGGTQLFANLRTGRYDREVVWNEEQTFGTKAVGGGGFSTTYAVPAFQARLGSLPSRGVPDISYDAAIDGGVLAAFSAGIYPRGTFFVFGGTSAGSPQWSGLTADIAQLNRGSLGDINPALYAIARSTPSAFHDITKGQNGDFGIGGFTAGTGWDAASGLGTPVANVLALELAARR